MTNGPESRALAPPRSPVEDLLRISIDLTRSSRLETAEVQTGMASNRLDDWVYKHQDARSDWSPAALENAFRRDARYFRALLSNYLPKDRDAEILDVPCGEGAIVYSLLLMGYRNVHGYDLDSRRVEVARKLALPVSEADVFNVLRQRGNGTVSCIVSASFIEHLEKMAAIDFISLAFEKLASGGTLILATPCADSPFGMAHVFNDLTHKWAATSGVLRWLLSSCGFDKVNIFGDHPKWSMSYGFVRVPLFSLATAPSSMYMKAMGQGRTIWSPTMWAAATKP